MNNKNFEIVKRITWHILNNYNLYDYDSVKFTIEHCFELKQDHHFPDKNKRGVLLIEDMIYTKSIGIADNYHEEFIFEYFNRLEVYLKKYNMKVCFTNKNFNCITDSIKGTIDILMNASNIQDIISKWKENKKEAYKNYHSK